MNRLLVLGLGMAQVAMICSCGPTVRRSGQIELFSLEQTGDTGQLRPPRRAFTEPKVLFEQARVGPTSRVDPELGDLVRFTTDSVTMTVPTVYLDHLPATLSSVTTGRYDAMLFAEVWENAAMDRGEPAINRIVHVALDQPVPGRLNFQDAIAYGPTLFKGHPMRIKFTLVLLQRRAKESGDTAAKSLQDFVSLAGAGTPTGAAASTVVALIRQIMRSLPDVEAFDFEVTFYPYNPPAASDIVAIGQSMAIADRIASVRKSPDLEKAQRLGRDLLEYSDLLSEDRYEHFRQSITDATNVMPGASRASVIAQLQQAQELDPPRAAGSQINEEIASLSSRAGPISRDEIASLQASKSSIVQAIEGAAKNQFVRVRQGAESLTNASTEEEIRAAIATIQSCGDYNRIEAVPGDIQAIQRAINARPWFRYSMYALVETAHYHFAGSPPREFDMRGVHFENERFQLQGATPGRSPNWMLLDILPGLQPVDDRTIRAASEAADRFRELSGYIPSRRLIEDPARLTEHLDTIHADTFETLMAVRAERLAVELARNAKSDGTSMSDVFKEDGMFMTRFAEDLESLRGTDSWKTEDKSRWLKVADRVRRQFDLRFR